MTGLAEALASARQGGALSIYLVSGHPGPGQSEAFFRAAADSGADWIELGIPFSDPGADGPVIQRASTKALQHGHRVEDALRLASSLNGTVPLVAMTYANIAYHRGWQTFAQELAAAGVDGLILPDVPLEESGPVRDALAAAGVAWVPLVTPMTSTERMRAIAATCTGFLYVVGNVGITGQADPGALVEETVARARSVTDVPLAVGFGIASPEDVRRVLAAGADAAIVGSHIVRMVDDGATPEQIGVEVQHLRSMMPAQVTTDEENH